MEGSIVKRLKGLSKYFPFGYLWEGLFLALQKATGKKRKWKMMWKWRSSYWSLFGNRNDSGREGHAPSPGIEPGTFQFANVTQPNKPHQSGQKIKNSFERFCLQLLSPESCRICFSTWLCLCPPVSLRIFQVCCFSPSSLFLSLWATCVHPFL